MSTGTSTGMVLAVLVAGVWYLYPQFLTPAARMVAQIMQLSVRGELGRERAITLAASEVKSIIEFEGEHHVRSCSR